MTHPTLGGVSINGKTVAGAYHAGHRIGLTRGNTLLLPSGRNLMPCGPVKDIGRRISISINADGGLRVLFHANTRVWDSVMWQSRIADLGLSPGQTITLSLPSNESITPGFFLSMGLHREDGSNIDSTGSIGDPNVTWLTKTITSDTAIIDVQFFNGVVPSNDVLMDLHPQLEVGDSPSAWEPPTAYRTDGYLRRDYS